MKNKFFKLLVLTFLLLVSVIGLVACGGGGTEGLEFRVDKENKEAVLLGVGDAEDVNIVIPEKYEGCTVVEIDENAFRNEGNIKSVVIPKTIKIIGGKAFYNCEDLETVAFADECSIEELGDQIFEECKKLVNVTLPSNLKMLGNGMFTYSAIEEITLPETITSLGNYTFSQCTKLQKIVIPSNVTKLEDGVFHTCTSLAEVNIPSGVKEIGKGCFYSCTSLTEISLPAGLTTIKTKAFEKCEKLATLNQETNDSLNYVGDYAFNNCKALTSIKLNEDIYVGESVFYGCNSLQYKVENGLKYLGNAQNPYLYLIDVDDETVNFKNVQISNNCYEITSGVFLGESKLKSVTISASVRKIGKQAFASCFSLVTVTFQAGSQLVSIGEMAFRECDELETIVIPEGTKIIGNFVFSWCISLNIITLPSTIEEIGMSPFYSTKINFNGTTSQWNGIKLHDDWNDDGKIKEVVCINGTIKIN